MKKIMKVLIMYILFLGLFLLLNTGFSFESPQLLFETFVFTVVVLLLIFYPSLKNLFVLLSVILFAIMIIFFVLDFINVANFFGSLGFGVLIISGLFYLPRLLKYGYI